MNSPRWRISRSVLCSAAVVATRAVDETCRRSTLGHSWQVGWPRGLGMGAVRGRAGRPRLSARVCSIKRPTSRRRGSPETLVLPFGTFHRLSSAAVEPSIFAQCLVAIVVLVGTVGLRGHSVFSRRWDLGGLIVMTSVLLLSTSTSAYIGLLFICLLAFPTFARNSSQRRRFGAAFCALAAAVAALCLSIRPVRGVFRATILNKLDSSSAHDRLSTVRDAWWHFVSIRFSAQVKRDCSDTRSGCFPPRKYRRPRRARVCESHCLCARPARYCTRRASTIQ